MGTNFRITWIVFSCYIFLLFPPLLNELWLLVGVFCLPQVYGVESSPFADISKSDFFPVICLTVITIEIILFSFLKRKRNYGGKEAIIHN